jgi:hypothetical protein
VAYKEHTATTHTHTYTHKAHTLSTHRKHKEDAVSFPWIHRPDGSTDVCVMCDVYRQVRWAAAEALGALGEHAGRVGDGMVVERLALAMVRSCALCSRRKKTG